jgi:CubicO group peptidase (beta-lactamase class C family)
MNHKQFTAMCTMILQEQGKLSVEDSVSKYLTNCPSAWSKIKLRHLRSRQSDSPSNTITPVIITTVSLFAPSEIFDPIL